MLKQFANKIKKQGLGTVLRLVRRKLFGQRAGCFELCKKYVEGKRGIEIGGPSQIFSSAGILPLYEVAGTVDNCNFFHDTVWEGKIAEGKRFRFNKDKEPGFQYIAEASDIKAVSSEEYDFVVSSHMLEHSANPLKCLQEWKRLLKPGGHLILIVPEKKGCFDHRRPDTSFEHIVVDYENNTGENDLTHLEEILEHHDLSLDPGAGTLEEFSQRSRNNAVNRTLHQHVFSREVLHKMLTHMGFKVESFECVPPYDLIILGTRNSL